MCKIILTENPLSVIPLDVILNGIYFTIIYVTRYSKRYLRALATSYSLGINTIQSWACSSLFQSGGSISDVSYDPTPVDSAMYR